MNLHLEISDRLNIISAKLTEAAARSGRSLSDVTLVAVSKTQPPEAVSAALAAGQQIFGESRVQEARAKIPAVGGRARWHFIGHLQKNKVRQALPFFELFHGVDTLELARDIARIATEEGARPRVLLEVNVAGEASKFGFGPEQLKAQLEDLLALDRLDIEGLMCIPPPQPRAELARRYFVTLRELRDRLETECRVKLPTLSMGMSGDFEVAVEEGATIVRVGTAIFGERTGKAWKPQAGMGED